MTSKKTFFKKPILKLPIPDLRPKSTSRVVNSGVRSPNINDDHKGSTPDIGAYEAGQDLPQYGPRPYRSA